LDSLKGLFGGQKSPEALERERAEMEALQARRQANLNQLMEEFSDAEHIEPKLYHELSIGEAKSGHTPGFEYLVNSAAVRLHTLMPLEQMRLAALIRAFGMELDPESGEPIGEVVDLKPKDQAAIEHGAVNLGPVEEFKNATGTRWRFFVELSYSAAASSGRGGIQTRHFIADCTL
jgi:hypothetical protein